MSKQKRKRLSAQKETKELKDENRRLNALVANLQGLSPPDSPPEEASSAQGSAKLKKGMAYSPNTGTTPVAAAGGSGRDSAAPKRLNLSEDSLSAISASLAQSVPVLGGAPKSMVLPRPAPPPNFPPPLPASSSPPTGSVHIHMGSAPVNFLNPASSSASSTSPPTSQPPASGGHVRSDSAPGTGSSINISSVSSIRLGMSPSGSSGSLNMSQDIFAPPTDLLYAQDKSLRAASLDTLIRLLPSSDSNYIDTFLMTYRAFCNAEELFSRMVQLWETASVQANTEALKVFRIKFMNVVIKWIEKHGVDFDDTSLMKVSRFLDAKLAEGVVSSTTHKKIAQLIRHKIERTTKKVLHNQDFLAPPPVVSPGLDELHELDITFIDPLEIARQITLLDEQAFKSIAPSECMNQSWNKPAICNEVSPNIIKMITRFNSTSTWSARLLVSEPNIRKRKSILTRIIKIAARLRELNNYHSLMAMIAALESAHVTRMKKTWDSVDSAYIKQFLELKAIMSAESSYKAYRTIIKTDDPPVIPYIGVYLADLTFIEDGNPSKIQDDSMGELINFAKMRLLDGIIQDMNMYQQAPYKLEPVPKIQTLLTAQEDIKSTDKELFDLSLKSEPRVQSK